MLVCFSRRDGHFGMQVVGRRDIHDIHLRVVDHFPPVGGPAGKAKLSRALCYGLLIYIRDNFQNRTARLIAKNERDIFERRSMGFPHEPGPDQANP
jgi:hypothetical protein